MKITIETNETELSQFIVERDRLKAQILQLSYVPTAHSIEKMAQDFDNELRGTSLTSDQRDMVVKKIRNYTGLKH